MKDNACVQVEDTRHPTETSPMRPEVGTQACFNLNKPRQTYRYDSSLSPALQWDGQHREGKPDYRWVKRFRGVRYRVTCESLGLPRDGWTKEDSWQAANQWWQDHLAELGQKPKSKQQVEDVIEAAGGLGFDQELVHLNQSSREDYRSNRPGCCGCSSPCRRRFPGRTAAGRCQRSA